VILFKILDLVIKLGVLFDIELVMNCLYCLAFLLLLDFFFIFMVPFLTNGDCFLFFFLQIKSHGVVFGKWY
jgi:hypothetical protein